MYSILIVEDNINELNNLKSMISEILPNDTIDTASTFLEAISLISKKNYSIFFLDIQLSDNKRENGITIGKLIRANKNTRLSPIIFTTTVTSAMKTALNDLHCYKFLEKPYGKKEIQKTLDEIIENNDCKAMPLSYKDINNIRIKISIDDILYVYSKGHITNIFCLDSEYQLSRVSLDKILEDTNGSLIRIHRSYLINPHYVTSVDTINNYVHVMNTAIPISVRSESILKEKLRDDLYD